MSQALASPANCCDPCESPLAGADIPGPAGEDGADGAAGTNGVNAFTDTTANFTQPAVGANVVVSVDSSAWAVPGQEVFVEGGGYYLVVAKPTAASVTLQNLGYDANAAPAAVIASGSHVGPAGEKGETGAVGSAGTTILTTKGDLLTHDGAAIARQGVGTDGKVLAADSAQALGVVWNTVQPNATTDNGIARYDGTAGKPVPLQDSKVVITDDGAVQASGSGGNARGTRAVDLQTVRALATQVASGADSVIAGGDSNLASGEESVVAGGKTNIASAIQATVGGGKDNEATAANATVCGGRDNEASGVESTCAGGATNRAIGQNTFSGGGGGHLLEADLSASIGGSSCIADMYSQVVHASGFFAAGGDAQYTDILWRNATTDATPTELFLDGAGERAVLRDGSWAFVIYLIASEQTAEDTAAWEIKGAIRKKAAGVTVVSALTKTLIAADAGSIAAGWGLVGNVAVTADVANASLKIAVTGAAATNIRWVAQGRLVEVYWGA